MNPKPNRYAFDIQAVIDTAREMGRLQEYNLRLVSAIASPEGAENERLKEENRKLEAMLEGCRESDNALADKARQALRLRGCHGYANVAGIGSGIAELIAFLDHALPVAPTQTTAMAELPSGDPT